jgi:preprotein translocase subunit Sec63
MVKDYYRILQLEPSATLTEIKQAYRRLAMTWHPDKNPDDAHAKAQFHEIKEAYETLAHPVKKDLYLQERWYQQSLGKKRTAVAITPVNILKLTLELERYVSHLDPHRMNREGLFNYIDELIAASTIEKLLAFNERDINRQIVTTILSALNPLPLKMSAQIIERLERLVAGDERSLERINQFQIKQKKIFFWNRYKFLVIIIATILICLLIYFTST